MFHLLAAFSALLLLESSCIAPARAQTLRRFPPLLNVARRRPLTTTPSQGTCGVPVRSAHCRSSLYSSSVRDCRQDFCVTECPRRFTQPAYSSLLAARGYGGGCVTTDNVNRRPSSPASGDPSVLFSAGTQCYLTPLVSPTLGANGAFTLTFWIYPAAPNLGTVVEKFTGAGETIFRVRVSSSTLVFLYRSNFGTLEIEFTEHIPVDTWTHIAIQVYDASVSYFVNGVGLGFAARDTKGLVGAVRDTNGTYRIAQSQSKDGVDQFVGRLQDIRFFGETLTNREVEAVHSGALPPVALQPACRCPGSHPRVKPQQTRYCIRNGVADNAGDDLLRLHNATHPLGYANDGDSNSVWVSAFLDDVTLHVDLQQQFQVFYVVLQFYSPLPKVVTIERRESSSSPWTRWQLYADDCETAFGVPNNGPLTDATSVNCLQFGKAGMLVPYSKGNITFHVLSSEPVARPGHNDFYNTDALFGFVRAAEVRVRLQGHYYVTHQRHRYYGVYEYIVTGRCNCHGHAESCDLKIQPYQCNCFEGSHTEGNQCERCAPLYNDKPFRMGDQLSAFPCRVCQCYGHADRCVYDRTVDPRPDSADLGGGGVCVECRGGTTGRQCDACVAFRYRPDGRSLFADDVCVPCDCHVPGVSDVNEDCNKVGGQCGCKQHVEGRRCDVCRVGYFNLQAANPAGCEPCGCDVAGTVAGSEACHAALGECQCKQNVRNARCDACKYGFYFLNAEIEVGCLPCACHPAGSTSPYCEPAAGACLCRANVVGRECSVCADGHHSFAAGCPPCGCGAGVVAGTLCDKETGRCVCQPHVNGTKCDGCDDGYYGLDAGGCRECGCNAAGTVGGGAGCELASGQCACKESVTGRHCEQCRPNTYNLQAGNAAGCEGCGCDANGTQQGTSCHQTTGVCTCVTNRIGRRCETCAGGFFLSATSHSCQPCGCSSAGSVPSVDCDAVTGQCLCKPDRPGTTGRACDSCLLGYYRRSSSCLRCLCDAVGSNGTLCDVTTGQCNCKEHTHERQCGKCKAGTSRMQKDNPYGCSKEPSQQPPPKYEPIDSHTMRLYWQPPDNPNGIITFYNLYRDGKEVAKIYPPGMEFTDSQLSPFTDYRYQLEAHNGVGSTRSPVVTYRTLAGTPAGVITLTVQDVTARAASFAWTPPVTGVNGVVTEYRLRSTTLSTATPVVHYRGLSLATRLHTLAPFEHYRFDAQVCTDGGCLTSAALGVTMLQDLPKGQRPPSVSGVSPTALLVRWQPPEHPNGIIIFYEVWLRGMPGREGVPDPAEKRVFNPAGQYFPRPTVVPGERTLEPPDTEVIVDALAPFTQYELQVFSENALGKAASGWARGRTREDVPVFMPAPDVAAVSSRQLNISWLAPSEREVRGVVLSYRVYIYKGSTAAEGPYAPPKKWMLADEGNGEERYALVGALRPHHNYTVLVEVCNSVGCINSTSVSQLTAPAVPESQPRPTVSGDNSTIMRVTWPAVVNANAANITYRVTRMHIPYAHPPPLMEQGVRYSQAGHYRFPPETIMQGVDFTGIEFYFKTRWKQGVMVYASSVGGQIEMIAIQLRRGRPWFLFDTGKCFVMVTTTNDEGMPYSDYLWHHLNVTRTGFKGEIVVDEEWTGSAVKANCDNAGHIIGENTGLYIGGLPDDFIFQRPLLDVRAELQQNDFHGCLRSVAILTQLQPQEIWEPLDWDTAESKTHGANEVWEGCPRDLQIGQHFLATGYLQIAPRKLLRGLSIQVKMMLRTELRDGLLLFTYGPAGEYLLLQLVDGVLEAELSYGVGRRLITLSSAHLRPSLCSGQWHGILLVKDTSSRFFLRVTPYGETSSVVSELLLSTERFITFTSHFYLGGVKPLPENLRFIAENNLAGRMQHSFGGCIKGFDIETPRSIIDFLLPEADPLDFEFSGVHLDGCPGYIESASIECASKLTEEIYLGPENETFDEGLNSFTEYQYQVEAINEVGSVQSAWVVGRTWIGVPTGVTRAQTIAVLSGYVIHATWQLPTGRTGPLTEVAIVAYPRDSSTLPTAQTRFTNTSVTAGYIRNARPYTNYTVHIAACTQAGCTKSTDGHDVTTFIEAPEGVHPPTALHSSDSYIVVGWLPADRPNGPFTGYVLYREDSEVYTGVEESFNVTGLHLYTGYKFQLKVCNSENCSVSEPAQLSTTQMPPTHVNPPRIKVQGAHVLRVEWDVPEELNGVLERYVLYQSDSAGRVGLPVYNSTDWFLYYLITNLTAGTTFYFRLQACTGAGCRMSNEASATTYETPPEGVQAPIVTSPDPTQLLVVWKQPLLPNGKITGYHLFHNSLLIHESTTVGQHLIDSLRAWSRHVLRLEACTAEGCAASDDVVAYTQEAPPQGAVGLSLRVDTARSVELRWNAVTRDNGRVYYDVYFEGNFYADPENWDYSLVSGRRSLHRGTASGQTVTVSGVRPHAAFYVQVNASNSAGFILSNVLQANMPMGAPDGVRPPDLTSPTSRSIRAVWRGVGRNNADQEPAFQLQFKRAQDGALVQNLFAEPSTSTTYLQTGLEPFVSYQMRVIASNAYGETASTWAHLTTRQDKPLHMVTPIVQDVTARSVNVTWKPPMTPNGIVTEYNIYWNNTLSQVVAGNETSMVLDDLVPFTTYIYRIEACTVAGCTTSDYTSPITTRKAVPEGLSAPILQSPTPTSVLIQWSAPRAPNGPLLQYNIERRTTADGVTLVHTAPPGGQLQYLDRSRELSPYTVYEYRIVAHTPLGNSTGPWARVRTKSSRPGGVIVPGVDIISPTSVHVTWEPPLHANGILESYIIKFPQPRFEIYNMSVTQLTVDDLVPFTSYKVTLTVCSDGGCSESAPADLMTSPYLPGGVRPPTPTPHSQTYISVTWQAPAKPNGPGVRYELSRMKTSQPLQADASGFGTWLSIFTGTSMYFEDRGLTIFTLYKYRLTVKNDYGQTTSQPSDEVATFGDVPRKAADVSVFSVNHTAIDIRWITPGVIELQGRVQHYLVTIIGESNTLTKTVAADKDSIIVASLQPNNRYEVTLVMVMHGGATIASIPVYVITKDGAPEGLDPPWLVAVNKTAIRVIWTAPAKPNGDIVTYNLYVDNERIRTRMVTAGSYVLTDLRPFTIYLVQVEVCTVFACLKSAGTQGTTTESVPSSVAPPRLHILSADSIRVQWLPPTKPNGIILRYELWRRMKMFCSEIPKPPVDPAPNRCAYVECGVLESFCGSQCYVGPKTCCDGVIHNNKVGYGCCGQHYIPMTRASNDVCCGGQFYARLVNHQCCGNRYVDVVPGWTCCPDMAEERVAVGKGDACCAAVPYSTAGSQICCNGEFSARFGKQCCEGRVLSDQLVCCGGESGRAFKRAPSHACCGSAYTNANLSTCCTDELGRTKVHLYGNATLKQAANEKCCGKQLVSTGLQCCNNVGYNRQTQVCADVSNSEADCGTGRVCPASQASSALCNRCNFMRTTHKCGSYVVRPSSAAPAPQTATPSGSNTDNMCLTDPIKIYTGNDITFTDADLSPYTIYEYSVLAVNSAGAKESDYSQATTLQALPQGLDPPVARVESDQLDTIYLHWSPPKKLNGRLVWFILLRGGVEIYRDPSAVEHKDDNAIQPYETYIYRLRVCNGVGCIDSAPVSVATLQASPELVGSPMVSAPNSTCLHLRWTLPGKTNGFIIRYILYELTADNSVTFPSDVRQHSLYGLDHYTEYTFVLSACTQAGCTNSSKVTARTQQDRPTGVSELRIVTINSTLLQLFWDPPAQLNGVLQSYRLYRSAGSLAYRVIAATAPDRLNHTDWDVLAGRRYAYILEAITGAGGTNSTPVWVSMPLTTPGGIGVPNVTVTGPRSLYIVWELLADTTVDQYRIVLNAGTLYQLDVGVGVSHPLKVFGLRPHTWYTVRLQACVRGQPNGCGTGDPTTVRTFSAAPEGQPPPTVTARGPSSVEVSWRPPARPNGELTQYRVERRLDGQPATEVLVNVVSAGSARRFTNAGPDLTAYTVYQYRVTARNTEGEARSAWAGVRTLDAAPTGMHAPRVTHVGAYAVDVVWQPPQRANGVLRVYRLEYRTMSDDPTSQMAADSVTLPADVLQTSLSGLQPYRRHELRLVAVNAIGSATSVWTHTTTAQAPPARLSGLQVERLLTGTGLILRWEAPRRPNGVIANYALYEAGRINALYQGLSREFEMRRLQPFTEYVVQLEACTGGGCARSPQQRVRTAEVEPSGQVAPQSGGVNATHATLRWSRPASPHGAILYYELRRRTAKRRLQRRDVTAADGDVVYRTDDTTALHYTYVDSDLLPFMRYEYSVRAANSRGHVDSAWLVVETREARPDQVAPPLVSQVAGAPRSLRVSWTAPGRVNGVLLGYQLQRNQSVPWSFSPADAREHVDTGLSAYTLYAYVVTACTVAGCTPSAHTIVRTAQSAPLYVAPPTVVAISSTRLNVTWTPPQVTNGRLVAYQLRVDSETTVYSGLATQHTLTGLVPYRLYSVVLSACTQGGCVDSAPASGRPLEAPPEAMPLPELRVTGTSSIEVSWGAPLRANGVITAYELRRDATLIDTTSGRRQFIDYDVRPGREYSYRVTAFNSRGSTVSPPALARTPAAAPTAIAAPRLTPLSATAISATWQPPAEPNGRIYNYTLYRDAEIVFSERQLSARVDGLDHWTTYTFRIQACTSNGCVTSPPATVTTLEAPPLGMEPPALAAYADSRGAHAGVSAQWARPHRPNGVIIRYDLLRRAAPGSFSPTSTERTLVYSGTQVSHVDDDTALRPYTRYEYMVTAVNSQGKADSEWRRIRTKEAPPENVPPPTITNTTHSTITVEIKAPERLNGPIRVYKIYLNDTLEVETLLSPVTLQSLAPYSAYRVRIAACTAAGCTSSPTVNTRTLARRPTGLRPPRIYNITPTSMDVSWQPPSSPNGKIHEYELSMRVGCPQPYADADDELTLPCVPGALLTWVRGEGVTHTRLTRLQPYTRYDVMLQVSNEAGPMERAVTASNHTMPAAPIYRKSHRPKLTAAGNVVTIDWTNSFYINGEVIEFLVYQDKKVIYRGFAFSYDVYRQSAYQTFKLYVRLVTREGSAQSETLFFDPTQKDFGELTTSGDGSTTAEPLTAMRPVYQEVWFIALMCVLAIALLFICIALCLRTTGRRIPYIRERIPLQRDDMVKAPVPLAYCIPYGGSAISADIARHPAALVANVGYDNASFHHLAASSRVTSLADVNLDKLSLRSSGWGDDEDAAWHGLLPDDSGLHSFVYGDDFDTESDRPISVLKQHTMFTDTHI